MQEEPEEGNTEDSDYQVWYASFSSLRLLLVWGQTRENTGFRSCGQGVSLYIPQPAINATVEEDILLSVDYSCHGIPTIEWKYTSSWGVQKIVEWKPGTQANISQSHKDRVCTFDNGSIQLFSVGVRDSGSYIVTVTERLGSSRFGTIVLHVSEILYEDLHFVAVFLAFLVAVAALLISLMWVCNKCAYKFQRKRRHKLKESTTEEIELQDVEC
nr:PREDICTED: V-set and transmembrane domain-containing protein 5 [Bos mutus]